ARTFSHATASGIEGSRRCPGAGGSVKVPTIVASVISLIQVSCEVRTSDRTIGEQSITRAAATEVGPLAFSLVSTDTQPRDKRGTTLSEDTTVSHNECPARMHSFY